MSWLRGQFIDIIEWLDNSNDTIAYRFQRHNNEIKQGAKLIVRPGQQAIFVNEGQAADAFGPGTHELFTRNLPILSTLQGWKYGFESPFKAEVYFFNTKVFTNLKWGTANPIMVRDPEFGPVRLRAFGTYNIRVRDPKPLLESLISTDGLFQVDEISDYLRNLIVPAVTTWIAGSGIPMLDLAARYREFGKNANAVVREELAPLGIDVVQLAIENISLPPEVEEALDKRSSMGILGNMQQYAQFQAANAIEASANNPNSGGNAALDAGIGLAMGQQMMNVMQQPQAAPSAPPPPQAPQWYLTRNGQQLGPFPREQLQQQGLTADTLVWRAGFSGWLPASGVAELQSLLPPAPPPTPPAASAPPPAPEPAPAPAPAPAPTPAPAIPTSPGSGWYLERNGQQVGPFSLPKLILEQFGPQTLVWRQGMASWQAAETVPELSTVLSAKSASQ